MSDDSDVPELVSSSSSDDSSDGDVPPICEHESAKYAHRAQRWLQEKSCEQTSNNHVVKVLTLAPFLFGQATWPDKWLRFACQVGLLPSASVFLVDTLSDEQLKNVELVENALDFLFPYLWEDQVALAVAMSVVEMCSAQEKLVDVTKTALKNTTFLNWLKKFHNSALVKNSDMTILALLISLRQYQEHVFKFVEKGQDVAVEFQEMVVGENKHVEEIKKQGNEEYQQGNYTKATSLYQRAIYMSGYNHVLYGNRAQAYLKLGDYQAAKLDGKRSVTLQPAWDRGWERYREACKFLGGPFPADLERREERDRKENTKNRVVEGTKSSYVMRQSSIDDSDSGSHRSSHSTQEDKQMSSESADHKDLGSENSSKTASEATDQPPVILHHQVLRSSSSTSKHKHKTSSTNQKAQTEVEAEKEKFEGYLIEGTTALQNQSSRTAVHYYQEALDLLNKHDICYFAFDLEKLVVLKYAIGTAHVNTGEDQEILSGIAVFHEIQSKHGAIHFPLVYLGLGHAYFAQNRFSDAVVPLQEGLAEVEQLPVTGVFCWPGTQIIIEESRPGQLKVELQLLLDQCSQPPSPDAVCRYYNCHGHYKLQIYFTDTDFKGFVRVACFAKCSVEYHVDCWKKMKASLDGRHSEKEILNGPCLTPDCGATVWVICIFNESGKVQKEWTAAPQEKKDKKLSVEKMKPSSVSTIEKRRIRKQLRKQRKKEQRAVEQQKADVKKSEDSSGNSSQTEGLDAKAQVSNVSMSPAKFATILRKDESSEDEMYKGVQSSKIRQRKKRKKKKVPTATLR